MNQPLLYNRPTVSVAWHGPTLRPQAFWQFHDKLFPMESEFLQLVPQHVVQLLFDHLKLIQRNFIDGKERRIGVKYS